MGAAGIIRMLGDGHVPAIRTGMLALVLGAFVMLSTLFLLTPAMDGMVGIGDHSLERPPAAPAPAARRPSPPPLTAKQRFVARRTAVRVAALEVGVRERTLNNSGRIKTYRRAVSGPGEKPWAAEPWCADFVSWAWRSAGIPLGFEGRGSDYVPELVAWASLTRRWHRARLGYRPRPGDLVVYNSGAHIGMVAAVRPGLITTIEGNYSDRVLRRTMKPWTPAITGFISPV